MSGLDIPQRLRAASVRHRNLPPHLSTAPAQVGPVKLEPLKSRRRPLPSTETGGVECDRDALTAPRLTPVRVTQSSTSFEVEDWEAARAYFFFRRLVFLAPFFAAAFAFVFRFFAMLPS